MSIVQQTGLEAQLSDLEQGKWLYANVFDIDLCTSEAMRQGWRLAEAEYERSYYAMMGVELVEDEAELFVDEW